MANLERKIHRIDAQGQSLGRLSSEIARLLQGKHKPEYENYTDIGDFVHILNMDKIKITGKKLEQKKYYRHSGRPGHLKEIAMSKEFKRDPKIVLKNAVNKMLPKNKLRTPRLKRLMFVKK